MVSRWLGAAASDFGRIVSRRPREVRVAACEQDVLEALRAAREHGIGVTVQGAGHSCNGQSLSDDGMLVRNRPGGERPRLTGDLVEISARSRWRDVESELHRAGRTIPVLADYLHLSVGGTLSVGGYGVDSVRHGAQVDHVTAVRLILPDGRALWCSRDAEPELFGYALAGLGQVGVIERVVMRTVPHHRFTTLFRYRHDSLDALVRSMAWLAEPGAELPTFFKALHSRGRFLSIYGAYARSWRTARESQPPPALRASTPRRVTVPGYRWWRSAAVSAWLARFPRHRRLWSDYLLSYDALLAFTAFLQAELSRDAFGGCLQAVYIVAIRRLPRPVRFPLEATDAMTGMCFGVGLYSMVPRRSADRLAAVRKTVRCCLDRAIELGGRPYLYGWHEMDDETRRRVYGSGYERLIELQRSLDPAACFQRHKLLLPGAVM